VQREEEEETPKASCRTPTFLDQGFVLWYYIMLSNCSYLTIISFRGSLFCRFIWTRIFWKSPRPGIRMVGSPLQIASFRFSFLLALHGHQVPNYIILPLFKLSLFSLLWFGIVCAWKKWYIDYIKITHSSSWYKMSHLSNLFFPSLETSMCDTIELSWFSMTSERSSSSKGSSIYSRDGGGLWVLVRFFG